LKFNSSVFDAEPPDLHNPFFISYSLGFHVFTIRRFTSYVSEMAVEGISQAKLLNSTKIDVLSVDKPVKLASISDALPGKTIMGNIATEDLMCLEPQAIYREACTKIEAMRGRKYILGAGCGVHDAPIENVKMFREASDACSKFSR